MIIYENEPMAPHTTFKIGGRARIFYEPSDLEDLNEIRASLNGGFGSAFFLGRGSNLLIKDGFIRTPFIRLTGEFKELTFNEETVVAGGAVPMPELAMQSARRGFSGLEWASGVPGTVGGAVMMNAGAYQNETADWLQRVVYMDREGEVCEKEASEIEFGYRNCDLRGEVLILRAEFKVKPAIGDKALNKTRELIKTRREQQPVGYNSAGCIFKNTDEYSAGELIDKAGLKGESEGRVYVSDKHANYFINRGGASFDDVLRLIDRVRRRIFDEFNVTLDLELCIVDE